MVEYWNTGYAKEYSGFYTIPSFQYSILPFSSGVNPAEVESAICE